MEKKELTCYDYNPSIIFGLYSRPDRKAQLFDELKKRNINFREFAGFIDVNIPFDRKDEILNFFKGFVMCDYWAGRLVDKKGFIVNVLKYLIEKVTSKFGYKLIKFKMGDWETDTRNKYLLTCCVPLFYQDTSHAFQNEEEYIFLDELSRFESNNYKANIETMERDDKRAKGQTTKKETI